MFFLYTFRFKVSYGGWRYAYNPCSSYNLPEDPHEGAGDQCHYVAVSSIIKHMLLAVAQSRRLPGALLLVSHVISYMVSHVMSHVIE